MLDLLNIVISSNFIYIVIILILIVIIIATVISIKKDRDKMIKKRIKEVEQPIEPARTKEEQEHAKLELEKVVNSMKNDLDKKVEPSEIVTYEREQEEKAIISYQELVEAVRKNNQQSKPQTEIGMEVASEEAVELPTSVEEQIEMEELNKKVEDILDTINNLSPVDDVLEKENINEENTLDTEVIEPKEEPKKFHTSEFISPIYGRHPQIEVKKASKDDLTDDVTSLDEIIDNDLNNTEEFLDSLKKFRDKL